MQSVANINIRKYSSGATSEVTDVLAVEEPLEMQLLFGQAGNKTKQPVSVTMRTPGNDDELCAGFLFTEGIISDRLQIEKTEVGISGENTVLVTLHESFIPLLKKAERNFYTTSSCGVCGKSSIDAIKTVSPFPETTDSLVVAPGVLTQMPARLRLQQSVFNSTGGLHASALFNLNGDFIDLREDVGRHNALDKLIGSAFLNGQLPLSNHMLLLSGRASFELIQKATMAGIKIIAAIGAPSSLAVELAEEQGVTLVGFLRDGHFNIYTHHRRIGQ